MSNNENTISISVVLLSSTSCHITIGLLHGSVIVSKTLAPVNKFFRICNANYILKCLSKNSFYIFHEDNYTFSLLTNDSILSKMHSTIWRQEENLHPFRAPVSKEQIIWMKM